MVRIHRVHSRGEHPFDDQLPEDFLRSKDELIAALSTRSGRAPVFYVRVIAVA